MVTTLTRSPRRVVVDRTNYCYNPKGQILDGWSATQPSGSPTVIASTGSTNPSGNNTFIRATSASASASLDIRHGGSGLNVLPSRGVPYTWSAYVLGTTANGLQASARVQWFDATDTAISTASGTVTTVAAVGWTRVSVTTGNAPGNAVRALVIVRFQAASGNLASGDMLYVTAGLLEKSSTVGTYFDGDTVPTDPDTVADWVDLQAKSASILGHNNPDDIVVPLLMTGFDMTRPSQNTYTPVPGRPDPVVNRRGLGARAGSIEFLLADEAEAAKLDAMMTDAGTFTLVDTDRPLYNMTFAFNPGGLRIKLDSQTRRRFVATIAAQEVVP